MSRPDLARRAVLTALALALAACATQAPPAAPTARIAANTTGSASTQPATPVAPAPTRPPAPPVEAPSPAPRADLATRRAEFVRETAARFNIPPARIEAALAGASIRDSIVNAMSRPAEAKPWRDYRPIFITEGRIAGGRSFLAQHREALARAEARTGVPAELIVAILGVETSYGGNTGSYPVVEALYTLAFAYPRTGDPAKAAREEQREQFFRDELAQLFALAQEQRLDLATLKGSYAGAMGWGQFMPSSYRDYAVDGNGDGRVDLFNSLDDVFASVANYFVGKGGWQRGKPVMVRALRDAGAADFNAESIEPVMTQAELAAMGYRPAGAVPADARATVIKLDGDNGPEYWMVFDNFKAITKYNNSRLYATAVWQLARAISGRPLAGVADAAPPPPA